MKLLFAIVFLCILISAATAQTNATLTVTGSVVSHGGHGGGGSGGWSSLKPIANFVGSPQSGIVSVTTQFTDKSFGNPTKWKWEYRSGNTWVNFSTEKNPSQTFTDGEYDIRLTVTNSYGSDSVTKLDYIDVHSKCRGWNDYEWLRWTCDHYGWAYGWR